MENRNLYMQGMDKEVIADLLEKGKQKLAQMPMNRWEFEN